MFTLDTARFDNTYARLPEMFYRRVKPTPLPAPYLVSFNEKAAELIGLDAEKADKPEFVEYFTGNKLLPGSEPISAIYAGHQFGTFVPQLGDGRAILLGEAVNEKGERFDIQLKGAGLTPFSRMGDGRAVLRSTIREYLCSEAMHALGIPTTRALCITGSNEPVYRETVETAAVLTRLAPTHVRFGSFELFYYRGQYEQVRELADYVIREFYSQFNGAEDKYLQFLREVIKRTAKLIAQWQSVGFAHGVMNTDNMSIIGLTIDYGPFGFLDEFDADFICNHSDYGGRYAFDQQPNVALWNLYKFAQTLIPLIKPEGAEAVLGEYQAIFTERLVELMRAKLGLEKQELEDPELIVALLEILQLSNVDYTVFFRRLGDFKTDANEKNDLLQGMFIDPKSFDQWAKIYRARLAKENISDAERREKMMRVNPKFVLRNHIAQSAIEKAQKGDYTEVNTLLEILQKPFDEKPEMERFAAPPTVGSKRVAVSCSS
ncbi:MAG: YdiU family protein [Acidobacteria bacterium]|nr:YdiU family protein [Acidobacteriota bacterium]MCA1638635.1 YdiU family protein [Acidobacteriota bacterium]